MSSLLQVHVTEETSPQAVKSKGAKPIRKKRTRAEASARNAEKWNTRQRAALPLFVHAGLEDHLVQLGVLVDRQPDHQLQRVADLDERMAALHETCRARAEVWRQVFKTQCPATYPETLLKLRSLRLRFPSMRSPVSTSDFWYTALRRALSAEAFLAILEEHWPAHAAVLKHGQRVQARIARQTALGQSNSWFPDAPPCES